MEEALRIDIPQENIAKFKEVLLIILNKIGAKPNVGKTVIHKLLYFIDFDFYELYEYQLMGVKYIKNTYGPTPIGFDEIIEQMDKNEEILIVSSKYFQHYQQKYLPLREADLSMFNGIELTHINNTITKYEDKTANQLSDLSHKDIPWIGAKNKELIDYDAVFYRNPDTSVRSYEF